jgi:DNA-binding transcriptional ArsR family regulator
MIQPEQTALLACVASRFKALSDVSRLRLLLVLRAGPQSVNALTQRLGIAQAGVSKHLAVLRGAGLVDSSRRKNQVIYHVADDRVFDLCAVVCDGVYRQIKTQQSLLTAPAAPLRSRPAAKPTLKPTLKQGASA